MINHQKRQPPTSSCPKPVTGRDLSEGAEKQRKAEREGSGEGQTIVQCAAREVPTPCLGVAFVALGPRSMARGRTAGPRGPNRGEAPEETKSEPRAKAAQQRPPRRRATLACRRRWTRARVRGPAGRGAAADGEATKAGISLQRLPRPPPPPSPPSLGACQGCARGSSSGLKRELGLALLEEADDLVGRSDASVVVCLDGLGAHLLLGEDHPLHVLVPNDRLRLLLRLEADVAQVAEVGPLLQHLEHLPLVHNLHPCSVDQGAALGHFEQQLLVDGLLGLRSQRHVQRHVLVLEEVRHGVHRLGAHFLDGVLRDVGVVGVQDHAEACCQLPHRPGDGPVAVEGDAAADELEAAGAVVVVAGACQHHAEHQLGDGVRVLPWGVHRRDRLRLTGLQVDVIVPSAGPHDDFQLRGLLQDRGVHDVAADDHGVHVGHGGQELVLALVVLQLLHGVLGLVEGGLDLGHRVGRKGPSRSPAALCAPCPPRPPLSEVSAGS
ncbi:unnamed protein product [Prorocentrum cordatum]|uniref:Uncharacterized protein n=2 Tax=Prorocentrum cordatum TaxID=2364126 RepID=A0ABN9U8X0_9DINO|nr:unnamed protein product [Polarella glacialis]